MIEGKCPKCGANYFGWALHSPRNQYCSTCGNSLDIIEDGKTYRGYSPFEAKKYDIRDNYNTSDLSDISKNPDNS